MTWEKSIIYLKDNDLTFGKQKNNKNCELPIFVV